MSLPPAPPPLPKIGNNSIISANNFVPDECIWAVKNPEIQRACYLARICREAPPKVCVFRHFEPIIQNGPTCGLTALSIIFNGHPTVDVLLQDAKNRKYTNLGEMFSSYYLYQIFINSFEDSKLQKDAQAFDHHFFDGHLDSDLIKTKLRNNAVILVPYDADRDNAPCLRKGHKAHWGLIIGYLEIENNNKSEDFYVITRHGKTKNLSVWSLKDLSSSNDNLYEFAQPVKHLNDELILPDGGLIGSLGLKNKSIIIEGLQNEIIKVV